MGLNTPLLVRSRSLWPGFGAPGRRRLGFGAGCPLEGGRLVPGAYAAPGVGVTALVCAR